MLRIPQRVSLPFGYHVTVKQVDDTVMNELASDADGYWNVGTRTILIRKRLPLKRRVYLLLHELQHALLDCTHEHMDSSDAKP